LLIPFFLGSSGICLVDHLLAIDTVATLGHGEIRGKVHLSHRCFALTAWNGPRLRRPVTVLKDHKLE
jgi:hypothetical protein